MRNKMSFFNKKVAFFQKSFIIVVPGEVPEWLNGTAC